MKYTFEWDVFLKSVGGNETYLTWLMTAWRWTLLVSVLSFALAFFAGFLFGVFRTTNNKFLVGIGNAWTELFRNIPLLVQLFLWYHVIPSILPIMNKIPSFLLVVIALGLFTSARISDQVKAGVFTIPTGQRYASLALGLTVIQSYRYVLLPQTIRIIIPPLTSEAMSIVKNSSVAFAIGIAELTMFAMQAQEETSRGIEIYLVVTGLYFISAFIVNLVAQFIEHKISISSSVGARK
jgi:glutamate/aspartate transport system permease protein